MLGELACGFGVRDEGDFGDVEHRVIARRILVEGEAEVGLAAVAAVIDEHAQLATTDFAVFDRHFELLLCGLRELNLT